MPGKKQQCALTQNNSAHNRALLKYRRKETLLKKIKELSQLCDLNLNLLIEDKRLNKVVQYHTNEAMKIENVMLRQSDGKNLKWNEPTQFRPLKIESRDLTKMFPKGIKDGAEEELEIAELALDECQAQEVGNLDENENSSPENMSRDSDEINGEQHV